VNLSVFVGEIKDEIIRLDILKNGNSISSFALYFCPKSKLYSK